MGNSRREPRLNPSAVSQALASATCLFAILLVTAPFLRSVSPTVSIDSAMTEIDGAVALGRAPDEELQRQIIAAGQTLPLLSDPFLVASIRAEAAGNGARAERLLLAARLRDPRSVAVRYFLADLYRQKGQMGRSLTEIAALQRLRSEASLPLAPYFAHIAQDPAGRRSLGRLTAGDPALGRQILNAMATADVDPAVVLDLSRSLPSDPADKAWQEKLLRRMVNSGDLSGAYEVWRQMAGPQNPPPQLNDPTFTDKAALMPFAWRYTASPDGVAEPDGKGGLSLLYYGRTSTVLAEQLIALTAGRHALAWHSTANGRDADAFAWRVTCHGQSAPLAQANVSRALMAFQVANDCPFATLQLVATAPVAEQVISTTISGLRLDKRP